MHELSQMKNNKYTVRMLDVILPVESKADLLQFKDLFIVMSLVEKDMESLFAQNRIKNFTEEHFLRILYNTLCCLNFLESANILHRDIKPNNILITD